MTLPLSDTDTAGGLLTIDLGALRANYRTLVRVAAPAACGAVVKANAYGLGAAKVAPALAEAGCRDFFVAHLGEAMALRSHLPPEASIAILNGLQPGGEQICAEYGLVPVLNGLEQIRAWAVLARRMGRRLPAALQVDSGMSRLGLSPAEVEQLAKCTDLLAAFEIRLLMSHLACADDPGHTANVTQRIVFNRFAAPTAEGPRLVCQFRRHPAGQGLRPRPRPARSRALRRQPNPHQPNPSQPNPGPAHRAAARHPSGRPRHPGPRRPPGTGIGYGSAFTADRPMRLATVAVGYADGWSRHLSNRGAAFAGDLRLPIVGRVSMDSTIVDVSALSEDALHLGSLVELIGPHQTLDDVAAQSGTSCTKF